ncbi:MAG: peptide chain release factor N(5)-glutamine methyltransferase [Pseudomonadaceae bacterium]|nr:peptide chain release factor N(5)-glutamine methyltransferase [Pseudomonadaceae bacterium]
MATISAWQNTHRALDRLDAHLLLADVLNVGRASILAHPERTLSEPELKRLTELANRREAGEPLAYLLGRQEFYGHSLMVTRDVLIPRPETETLVELALEVIPSGESVLELGTGSGAIAIALAEALTVTATDESDASLAIAQANARTHLKEITFRQGDWFAALAGDEPPFAAVVSNPPYIAEAHPALAELSYEPRAALASGPDGLDDIRRIVAGSGRHLKPGGWLMLEHGYDQAAGVAKLMASEGFQQIACHQDLAGIDRVSIGRWPDNGSGE